VLRVRTLDVDDDPDGGRREDQRVVLVRNAIESPHRRHFHTTSTKNGGQPSRADVVIASATFSPSVG
jgi:hypothetical protein